MAARLWCLLRLHCYAHSETTAPVLICVDCNHIHIPKEHP